MRRGWWGAGLRDELAAAGLVVEDSGSGREMERMAHEQSSAVECAFCRATTDLLLFGAPTETPEEAARRNGEMCAEHEQAFGEWLARVVKAAKEAKTSR